MCVCVCACVCVDKRIPDSAYNHRFDGVLVLIDIARGIENSMFTRRGAQGASSHCLVYFLCELHVYG